MVDGPTFEVPKALTKSPKPITGGPKYPPISPLNEECGLPPLQLSVVDEGLENKGKDCFRQVGNSEEGGREGN